ncbi:MAG: type VI secretion system-associated FHA domain protein TagH [Sphingomonadaceae bacterium]|nr:type VI secretion system-associated FHA domain protein TagH [Sphingomonadaceae bacterium]
MYVFRLFDKADPAHPLDARILREGSLSIGRDPGSDWVLIDPECQISRAHCELLAGPDGLSLVSLGSNGVFDGDTEERFPADRPVPLALPRTLEFGHFRLVADRAPDEELAPGGAARTMVFSAPLGDSVDVPSDWSDAPSIAANDGAEEVSLLEAFCQGAGLDASLFSTEDPAVVMRRAGAVYRQMVLGVGDLMAERERARAQYKLVRTTIGGVDNNPFKWAPTQRLAIDLLLAGESSFLSGPAALKASFRDVKKHLVATFAGLRASLRSAVDSFAPARIEDAVAGRGSLLKGGGALRWEEVSARHADLHRQLEEGAEGSLNAAFVVAYDAAAAALDGGPQ